MDILEKLREAANKKTSPKEQLAETILYWIASERENFVEMDGFGEERDENKYYLYTGNINYLIDFTSAYKEFIQDMIQEIKYECNFVKDIECVEVRKQEIILKINNIKTIICVDDEWLRISFKEEENV